jgi:hypothetical protein
LVKFVPAVIRRLTVEALDDVYKRLNVKFDEIHGESMYECGGKHIRKEEVILCRERRGLTWFFGPLI